MPHACREVRRRTLRDSFVRCAEVFPDIHIQKAESGVGQLSADLRGACFPAGEEEGGAILTDGRDRVAVHPMCRAQKPVLPGPSELCGEGLHTGNAGQQAHVLSAQLRQQHARAGIETAVPAVKNADLFAVCAVNGRFDRGHRDGLDLGLIRSVFSQESG